MEGRLPFVFRIADIIAFFMKKSNLAIHIHF